MAFLNPNHPMHLPFRTWLAQARERSRRPDAPEPPKSDYTAVTFLSGYPMIHAREGLALTIPAGEWATPCNVFMTTLMASCALDGQPVRCSGYMPGISMLAAAHFPVDDRAVQQMTRQWMEACLPMQSWVESAQRYPSVTLPLSQASITLALEEFVTLEPGAMSIHIARTWGPSSWESGAPPPRHTG